jgi:hypothetical protein
LKTLKNGKIVLLYRHDSFSGWAVQQRGWAGMAKFSDPGCKLKRK